MLKKLFGFVGCCTLISVSVPALAQEMEGNWMVRVRAVHLDMENKSSEGNGNQGITATVLPKDAVHVSNKTIPEVDISYFFHKNLAAELILTYPQKHNVTITSGPLAESIGSFKHLPPTLTLQYHFMPDAQFRPYVGLGINYTRISSVKLHSNAGNADLTLDSSSIGPAVQIGADFKIAKNMFLNLDIKKIYIDSDIKINGTKVSDAKLNPLAIGVGIGWRF